jgi:hypothetical protein
MKNLSVICLLLFMGLSNIAFADENCTVPSQLNSGGTLLIDDVNMAQAIVSPESVMNAVTDNTSVVCHRQCADCSMVRPCIPIPGGHCKIKHRICHIVHHRS